MKLPADPTLDLYARAATATSPAHISSRGRRSQERARSNAEQRNEVIVGPSWFLLVSMEDNIEETHFAAGMIGSTMCEGRSRLW